MKRIVKSNKEDYQWFEDWKESENPKVWDSLKNPEKNELRSILVKEQMYLCCYCNQAIKNDYKTHIEHFFPKDASLFPAKMFEVNNLLASCDGGERNPKPRETYCDSFKGNTVPSMHISPLDSDCEELFSCSIFGELSSDNEKANNTIRLLNLNAVVLKVRRERAIENYINALDSKCDFEEEIQLLMTPINEKLEPFCVHIAFVLRAYYQ